MKKAILYYGRKLFAFLLSVILLSFAVFCLSRMTPTDPLLSYYGDRVEKMSVAEKEAARESLGLNQPIVHQYLRWAANTCRGDFGISFQYKQPVTTVISQRLPNTLILGGIGFVLTFALALGLGILCAWHENRWLDKILCKLGAFISCIPEFWLSIVFILIFCVLLGWLPSSGAYSIGNAHNFLDRVVHLILPMSVVVISHLWYYAYMLRNKLLEEIRADYVLLGKAKGLSKGQLLFGHCLRNVLPTYFSIMAISVPHIFGGTYIVETVFGYPGIGTLSYESARFADYNLLMLLCMMTGVMVIFCNMISQIINERIDPRLKAEDHTEVNSL